MKRITLLAKLFFLCLLILACDNGKKDYEKTQQANTIQTYEEFIQKHPDSKFVEDAKEKLDSLRYEMVTSKDNADAYEDFIKKHPDSKYVSKANNILDSLRFSKVESIDSLEIYLSFLENYPHSAFTDKAKHRIEELAFYRVKKKDEIKEYQGFITKYPKSQFAFKAKKRLEFLKLIPPKYSDILRTYPENAEIRHIDVELSEVTADEVWVLSAGKLFLSGRNVEVAEGGKFSIHVSWLRHYGAKITIKNKITINGKTYKPSTKLTVDKKLHWIVVSSWD